jgi:hypothetical protein
MATPVVVSRIQNRRGLQIEFNGLVWSGGTGPDSIYPMGYTGIEGYDGFPDFTAVNYPNVLLPGELCLCTDSQNIYMGDLNGTYIIVATGVPGGLALDQLTPSVWELWGGQPYGTITRTIAGPTTVTLEYDATPFFNIMYSVTDASVPEWNATGPNYAENGILQVTAVQYFTPNIPNPPAGDITPATLVNTSSMIDKNVATTPVNLSFIAQYDVTQTKIQILFRHDYEGALILSTSTIKWITI